MIHHDHINQYMETRNFCGRPIQVLDEAGVGFDEISYWARKTGESKLKLEFAVKLRPIQVNRFLNNFTIDYISCSPLEYRRQNDLGSTAL